MRAEQLFVLDVKRLVAGNFENICAMRCETIPPHGFLDELDESCHGTESKQWFPWSPNLLFRRAVVNAVSEISHRWCQACRVDGVFGGDLKLPSNASGPWSAILKKIKNYETEKKTLTHPSSLIMKSCKGTEPELSIRDHFL